MFLCYSPICVGRFMQNKISNKLCFAHFMGDEMFWSVNLTECWNLRPICLPNYKCQFQMQMFAHEWLDFPTEKKKDTIFTGSLTWTAERLFILYKIKPNDKKRIEFCKAAVAIVLSMCVCVCACERHCATAMCHDYHKRKKK